MLAHHLGPRLRLDPAHGALYGTRRYLSAALRAKLRQSRPSASSTIRNSAERQPDRPAPAMSAVPAAASAAGSAAAAASHAAGTPPQLEDLPLRFLARHRQHAASGLRQASSPSASRDGGGGAATEDGWRIAYRHWRQPVPREQAPQATEGQVAGSSHGPGGRAASAAGTAVQPRPHTCVLFCNGLKSEMAGSKVRCALQQAAAQGCEFVCFDYSGFGASTGRAWESCGLTDWIEDTEALLREVVAAPRVVLLGSSIGGWVALRVAQRSATRAQSTLATAATCQGRGSSSSTSSTSSSSGSSSSSRGPQITGALLVAPAVDLSEVRWAALTQQQRDSVTAAAASSKTAAGSEGARGSGDGDGGAGGRVSLGSPYPMQGGDWVGPAYFTQGREHLLLVRPWGEAGRREGQLGPSGWGPEQLGGRPGVLWPGTAAGSIVWRRPLEVRVPVPLPVLIVAGSNDAVVPLPLVRTLVDGINNASAAAATATAAAVVAGGATAQLPPPQLGGGTKAYHHCGLGEVVDVNHGVWEEGKRCTEGLGAAVVREAAAAAAPEAAGCELHVVEGGDHRLSNATGLLVLRALLGRLLSASRLAQV